MAAPFARLRASASPRRAALVRLAVLVACYLAIQVALLVLYGPRDFSAPAFIYQAF
jgi:hypothetical protein